ncbi:MAG TPA: hypothetical protein VMZ28_03480 [Kofleriaceae bacterium]|nr:hypothetical protein [Kofleriaceae bacterium]
MARWGLVLVLVLVLVSVLVPRDARGDGATLPKGRGAVSLTLQSGLSKGQGAEPLSVAPDVWYGVTEGWQVGGVSSVQGMTGFWSGALSGYTGSGACLSGTPEDGADAGCGGLFESGGIESIIGGHWQVPVLATAGFYVLDDDPMVLRAKFGLRAHVAVDRFSIGASPSVFLGNDKLVFVPVEVGFSVVDRLRVGLQSGYIRSWPEAGDEWSAIPVAAGVVFLVTPTLVTGASFSFDRVGGFEGPGPFDQRSASLMVGTML